MIKPLLVIFALLSCISCSGFEENGDSIPQIPTLARYTNPGTPVAKVSESISSSANLIREAIEKRKNTEVIMSIIKSDPTIDIYKPEYWTKDLIYVAYMFRRTHPEIFLKLFELPAFEVNRMRHDGTTIFHFLIRQGDIEMLKILFNQFRDVINCNQVSSFGILPLDFARDKEQVFDFLLENAPGLDVTSLDGFGFSVFETVLNSGKMSRIRKMLNRPETRR